jgi:23S rRNA pseudouridine1911/1915/1917 synthase
MQALDAAGLAAARNASARSHVSASGYSDPRLDIRPRRARTRWAVLRRLPDATLLRLQLDTGRTHQIRVHLQGIGVPLLGDPIYGPQPAGLDAGFRAAHLLLGRPALHAAVLAFEHPRTGRRLRFRAPLPHDLRELLRRLSILGAGAGPSEAGEVRAIAQEDDDGEHQVDHRHLQADVLEDEL